MTYNEFIQLIGALASLTSAIGQLVLIWKQPP